MTETSIVIAPAFIGALESGLFTKLQATLHTHTIGLESPGLREVLGFLTCLSSFTVDIGTEKGLGLFRKIPIEFLVQSWRLAQPNIVSVDGDGDNSCMMAAMDSGTANVPPEFSEKLFAWPLVTPGIVHMMSTVSDHMMNSLLCVERIRLRFTALCSILSQSVRRAQKDPQDPPQEPRTTVRRRIPLGSAIAGALETEQRPALFLCCVEGETLLGRALVFAKVSGWLGGGRRHWKPGLRPPMPRTPRSNASTGWWRSGAQNEAIGDPKFGGNCVASARVAWQTSRRSRMVALATAPI